MRNHFHLLFLSLLIQPLFVTCVHADETVRIQLKWRHQFQFAGYYVAKIKGYYSDAGLDVELLEARPGTDTLEEVLQGRAEYGVGNSGIILSRAAGEPLVVMAVIMQHSPFVLLTQQNDSISDVQDLTHKRLMIEPLAEDILAYLHHEHVPLDSVTLLKHHHNIQHFIDGRVDAMSAYTTDEPYLLNKKNIKYNTFSPRSAGIDFYGDNLFTTESELLNHPERAKRFREASLRGWHYAMSHQDEIIDLILKNFPDSKDRAALAFEANAIRDLMHPELIDIGYMLKGRWRHIAETYASLGMLPTDFSVDDMLYDPNPQKDYTWLFLSSAITLTILLMVLAVTLRISRLNQQLKRLLHIKSHFANIGESVNNISHQWKQPLNELGIQLMLIEQSLQGTDCAQPTRNTIMSATDKCHDILDFMANTVHAFGHLLNINTSRITDFSPQQSINEVLYLISDTFKEHAITLSHDINSNVRLNGNPIEFAHVILSILNNARDIFLERNCEKPTLKLHCCDQGGTYYLKISDNAGGITAAPIDKIFTLGYSNNQSRDSGIGLYIARQIVVNQFHGVITAENRDNGACFTIAIPTVEHSEA